MASVTVAPVNVVPKSVLVASDFSITSDRPLRHALAIARHFGAQFYLAHVAPPKAIGCAGAVRLAIDTARRDSEQLNQQLLQSGALASLRHEFIVREGKVWEQLEQIIREKRVDLLVIGTHARHALGKLLLGSIAEQIFRQAECLVLTVGPGPERDSRIEQHQGLGTFLFATDFGVASWHALPHAVSFANHFGAKLVLLHVLPTVPMPEGFHWSVTTEDVTQIRENARLAVLPRLEELISQQAPLAVKPEFIVQFGIPGEQILHAAHVRKAAVIIMGLNRSAHIDTASHLPWATAYQVVCGAGCPVLTLKN
jgi:nucleotide-binding universal stress UspA family protein